MELQLKGPAPSGAARYHMKTDKIFNAGFKTREGKAKSKFTTFGNTQPRKSNFIRG